MSSVSVTDVRIALNNITPEEVTDDTIGQKIEDAIWYADQFGVSDAELRKRFVRAYAAWRSFLVSRSYVRSKIGTVSVQRDLEMMANALKEEAEEIINDASDSFQVVSTPMFDDRPDDPFYCDEDADVDQTEL